jgi:hypothetical protein
MKKNSQIDKIKAASIIENQIQFSLKIRLNELELHPIRLIQASKSLIGLNLDKPNLKLINFNSIFLQGFDNSDFYIFEKNSNDLKSVISIHDLESAFIKKDRKLIIKLFNELMSVSSEVHILEYLIELSLKQTGKSFLSIWSIYKSILFLNNGSRDFIYLAADIILSDEFEDSSSLDASIDINDIIKYDLSFNSIDLYSHLLEAYNGNLIRTSNIKTLVKSLINRKFKKNKINNFNISDDNKFPNLLKDGRKSLLSFVDGKDILNINPDLILLLDSIRSLVRLLDNKNHKIVCFHFEKILEGFYV